MKKPESVKQVSPPLFHEVVSPRLPSDYQKFDSMIRYVVRKEDENTVKTFCMWLAKDTDWCHRDFYESWRILRKVHEPKISREHKFREVAKILDAAMFEYIINDYTPNIDLQSALKKYLTTGDVETVIGEIREGKHMENTQTRETSQQDLRLRAQQEKGKLAFFLCLFFQFLYSAEQLLHLVTG